jgi:cytochrome P450
VAAADHLLDELIGRERADAATGLADVLPLRIMAERVIGFRVADIDQMRRWVFGGSRFQGGRLRLDELAAADVEVAGMWLWVRSSWTRPSQRRRRATTSLIGNSVRTLAERPQLQDQLRADTDLVPAFIEEVLRYESPFSFHPRTARGPVELGGVEIPDRAMVMPLW